jgi:hypothetical protein
MITTDDSRWLETTYPGLVAGGNGVTGTIQFTATYNSATNRFLTLRENAADDVGGIAMTCRYRVGIHPQPPTLLALPLLYVEGVEPVADRHFRRNKSACLCSPLEEEDFFTPKFEFKRFLEQLVIPFLYGQSFYSEHNRWPWREYAHNSTGLLESFYDRNIHDIEKLQALLAMLSLDRQSWPQLRAVLQRDEVKGHLPCFCEKHDHLRRCHPKALAGLRKLRQILTAESIPLPAP